MQQIAAAHQADNQLLFLPGVFNETLALLFDAHHYFQSRGAEDQSALRASERNLYANEMSRVTMRLTSVMAWVMVRRAVHAGRIDEEKAATDYRLNGDDVCLIPPGQQLSDMPYYLNYLADRSHSLYQRVWRLDQMVSGNA